MEKKSSVKLDFMLNIQRQIQQKWEKDKLFEIDAPSDTVERVEKFFVTFPYPYMNGCLHLGHAFSLTKCEFAAGYQRLKGRRCLFPLGFHCTGMPIKASADKLKREMNEYGFPPQFPDASNVEEESEKYDPFRDKTKSKKSKLISKTGKTKFQWEIMRSLGFNDQEIKDFADSLHWLRYFPKRCKKDVEAMGLKVCGDKRFYHDE